MPVRPQRLLQHIRRRAPPSSAPDAVLLERFVRDRDEESFAALVGRHGPMVLGLCRRVLGHEQDAEDAFQATFFVLARRAAAVRPSEALAAFLYGVSRRVALKARAARARRASADRPLVEPPEAPRAGPLDELSARELLTIFDEELQRLPQTYRLPLILCCLEGRSQEEAAGQLGWTPGSVKGRLERGRARLHARLLRRGLTLSAALMAAEASRGSVTASLSAATTDAALRFARGRVEGAGAALAERVLRAMARGKQTLLAAVLAASLALAGTGAVARHMAADPPQSPAPPAQADAEPPPQLDRHGDPLPPRAIARLGTLRFRGVRGCLTFSPDGKLLAAATGPGGEHITLWDVRTGREVRQIAGAASLTRLAFSPDGKRLVVFSQSIRCRVVDADSGAERFTLPGSCGGLSGDGKVLVTGQTIGPSARVRAWDAANGKPLGRGLAAEAQELAVADDGFTVAFIDPRNPSVVSIADLKKEAVVHSLRLGSEGRASIALSGDGRTLASADQGGVRLWDVAREEEVRRWPGRGEGRPVFAPDGKRLAWVGFDARGQGPSRLWTAGRDDKEPRALLGPVYLAESPALSPDGKLLAVVTAGHAISLRDAIRGEEVRPLQAHRDPVFRIALAPDADEVVTSSVSGVFTWEARTGRPLHQTPLPLPGHEYVEALLPDGRLLTADRTANPLNGLFRLRSARTGEELWRFEGRPDVGPPVAAVAPGGRHVAVHGRKGEVCVLDVRTGRCKYQFDPHERHPGLKVSADGDVLVWLGREKEKEVVRVRRQSSGKTLALRDLPKTDRWLWIFERVPCVSPDGRWLVLAVPTGQMRRWDLTTGEEVSPLAESQRTVWEMAWSSDGRFVATHGSSSAPTAIDFSARQDVRVWDATTGDRLPHLTLEDRGGSRMVFSHDGRTLLTTDLEGVIRAREVLTGQERLVLRGHLAGEIGSLAFGRDDRVLVSGGYDTQGFVWDLTGRMSDGRWRTATLSPEQRMSAWEALAGADGRAAYAALWRLAADPEGTVALLRERLRPVARPEAGEVARLLAALDSSEFAERERAERRLEAMEESAAAELRQALGRKPSLEVRRRIEALLEKLTGTPHGRQLQTLRAAEVLERIDTADARDLLRKLADGAPLARATEEAKAALRRSAESPSRER